MAIGLFTFLRRLFGGAPSAETKSIDAGDVAQAPSEPAPPVSESRKNEIGFAPTGWGDTQSQSDPWRDTKSEALLQSADPALPSPFDGDVDTSFTAFLLGINNFREGQASAAERHIIAKLTELASGRGDQNIVPRLPMVLPELMRLSRRDDVSPRELTDRVSNDPTMVGEVVHMANSPRYSPGRDIENLQEAVMILGQRGMNQLLAGVAMRPIFNKGQGRFSRLSGTRLWDLAERCSHTCVVMSDRNADVFHAYLAGMVANVGLIAALRVLDQEYKEPQAPDSEEFHKALRGAAVNLSGRIAEQWDFPPEVCHAVGALLSAEPGSGANNLTLALRVADRSGKWHMLVPGQPASGLAGLNESERRCYLELERAFGR